MADNSPAVRWNEDVAQRTLDELFDLARKYKTTSEYHDFLKFIARFRFYSPYNAMLVHLQMPDARFIAPPHRWLRDYGRRIKPAQRPLIILQPMGPVMSVFDVSQTEAEDGAPPLPPEVEHPFEVEGGYIGDELPKTIGNAKRDGIDVIEVKAGSQSAGAIGSAAGNRRLEFLG